MEDAMTRTMIAALCAAAACGGRTPPSTPPSPTPAPTTTATATPAAPPPPPVSAPTAHPSSDLIPRILFFGNPQRVGAKLSPDGKHLAWIAPKDGVMNVWVAPADHVDQARAVTAETARPIPYFTWTYDGKHLVYGQDKAGDENFHLYRVDVTAPGDALDLTPYANTTAYLAASSERKPGTILIAMNDRDPKLHDLYAVDLATGKRSELVENKAGYGGYLIDADLVPRLTMTTTPDGGQAITELAPPKGKPPFTTTIPADDALTSHPIDFDGTGRVVYAADSRGRDTGAIVAIDVRSGKQTTIAEDPRADLSDVLVHPTSRAVQAVKIEYDQATWKAVDPKVQPDLDALAKIGGADFDVPSRTLDDKTWLVVFHSDAKGDSYYRWDRKAKKASFLFDARPELATYTLPRRAPVIIKSRDGLDLVGYLSRSATAAGPLPMVLLVHGGPWARDVAGYNGVAQFLASRGYAVLQVNYRGSTGFGKTFVNAGNRQWGKKMHDDLLDAVDWAVAQGVTKKDTVAIVGGSYGGYATLVGLTLTPQEFVCGVDVVGPSNLATLLATLPPYWQPEIAMWKQRVGDWTTDEGKAALAAVSPLTHAAAIARPLLIGQGANDPRVKQAESDQIVKAMQANRIPVSYLLFPDEGHGFRRPENNVAFWAVAEAFLSAHLGGLYQPMSKDDFKGSTIQFVAGKDGIPGLPAGM
jgi:dipeptidyl aminopeptidase/acylaminoacyl peptidase